MRSTTFWADLDGVGIKGARDLFPTDDPAVVESWCWDQDAVCQRPPLGHAFHGNIYNDFEEQAAANAVAALKPFYATR